MHSVRDDRTRRAWSYEGTTWKLPVRTDCDLHI